MLRAALCGFFGGATTRTIGSASTEAPFPAQSVAWIVTGKIPARDGSGHETVCQPPDTDSQRSRPSAETRTDEGFETQKVTAPTPASPSLNAGGFVPNPANSVAAGAKRSSARASVCRSWTT